MVAIKFVDPQRAPGSVRRPMLFSDWEGPWVIADHAFELAQHSIRQGAGLYSTLSNYVLGNLEAGRGNFQPGDTLALIAPFLIANGAGESDLHQIAISGANFLDGAGKAVKYLKRHEIALRIISTSYSQYVNYTAGLIGIPGMHTISTRFPIGELRGAVREADMESVRHAAKSILELRRAGPDFSGNRQVNAGSMAAFLDRFFDELAHNSFSTVMQTVRPMGGERKLDALREVLEADGMGIDNAVVVGDSVTDGSMLRAASVEGGLSISFNGNVHAVQNSLVAVMSQSCIIIPVLVQIFGRKGMEGVEKVASNWNLRTLGKETGEGFLDRELLLELKRLDGSGRFPIAQWITGSNRDDITARSAEFRKTVRGVNVGAID